MNTSTQPEYFTRQKPVAWTSESWLREANGHYVTVPHSSFEVPLYAAPVEISQKWFQTAPAFSGQYLVVQQKRPGGPRYMWVRGFNDRYGWLNLKEYEYGPVTHWTHLPGWPDQPDNGQEVSDGR